jgi:deoxycytidylate deaminase
VHDETLKALREKGSELVFGVTAAVGADVDGLVSNLETKLPFYGYEARSIRLSSFLESIDSTWLRVKLAASPEFDRIWTHMDAGDAVRKETNCDEALALWAIASVNAGRKDVALEKEPLGKRAHILRTVKHPDEVRVLREVYKSGFYLIALHTPEKDRIERLMTLDGMSNEDARRLIHRDQGDNEPSYGQHTRDTFQMADVFVPPGPTMGKSLVRFLDLIFGSALETPTRDEHAMFMAYSASLRSADLSRQVGAVLRKDGIGIVGTGCNDVPAPGGGLYWSDDAEFDKRDLNFPRKGGGPGGHDSNDRHKRDIAADVVKRVHDDVADAVERIYKECAKQIAIGGGHAYADEHVRLVAAQEMASLDRTLRASLLKSRVFDITEFGRAVHAEMEAILSCTRSGISTRGATLLCTTFPCHNCAKHIVDAGIRRVVYIEPYPKSQAMDLHRDSIMLDESFSVGTTPSENWGSERNNIEPARPVAFQPFIGIGPRRFVDLFSMHLSSGLPLRRKDKETGDAVSFDRAQSSVRVPMSTSSYMEREDRLVTTVIAQLMETSK